jgi:hypothetical protein
MIGSRPNWRILKQRDFGCGEPDSPKYAGNPGIFEKTAYRSGSVRALHLGAAVLYGSLSDRTLSDFQVRPIHGAVYPAKICNPARESFLRRGRNTLQADATAPCIFFLPRAEPGLVFQLSICQAQKRPHGLNATLGAKEELVVLGWTTSLCLGTFVYWFR